VWGGLSGGPFSWKEEKGKGGFLNVIVKIGDTKSIYERIWGLTSFCEGGSIGSCVGGLLDVLG